MQKWYNTITVKIDLPIERKTPSFLSKNVMVKSKFGKDESYVSAYKRLENNKGLGKGGNLEMKRQGLNQEK